MRRYLSAALSFILAFSLFPSNISFAETDDYGNSFASAVEIQVDNEVQGNIEIAGDTDFIKVTPAAAGMYIIQSKGTTNVRGFLYDNLEKTLALDDNSGTGNNFYIACPLAANVTYYIKVNHYSGTGTGSYSVIVSRVSDDYGNNDSYASPIEVNCELQGAIEYACDTDVFRFIPPVSGAYSFESTGTTDTYGYVARAGSNTRLCTGDNISAANTNFLMSATLTANQAYYVYVNHKNSMDMDTAGTGPYGLKVYAIPDDHGNDYTTAKQVEIGTEIACSIESAGDTDYIKFIPSASGTYTIQSTGTSDMIGALFNYAKSVLCSNDNAGLGQNFYLNSYLYAGETYYIKSNHAQNTMTGAYGIKISQVPDDFRNDANNASEISLNNEISGIIDYACDTDVFRFIPAASGTYTFESTGTTDTYSYVTGTGSNTWLCTGDNASAANTNFRMSAVLTANQTYFVYVKHAKNSDMDTA
ncbi:MAG: hypothetical protein N3I35_11965, partial [Clostridia bacterium]|nr:hypothetical protein [Clostridia bacterium]